MVFCINCNVPTNSLFITMFKQQRGQHCWYYNRRSSFSEWHMSHFSRVYSKRWRSIRRLRWRVNITILQSILYLSWSFISNAWNLDVNLIFPIFRLGLVFVACSWLLHVDPQYLKIVLTLKIQLFQMRTLPQQHVHIPSKNAIVVRKNGNKSINVNYKSVFKK